jgi:hypothetical protein
LFHIRILAGDQCSRAGLERRQHAQWNSVLAGEFHRAGLQDLGTQAGELQHFLRRNAVQTPRLRHHPRIGGVDSVHVGIYAALVGLQRGCHGHRGGVGAAPAEGSDILIIIHPLESGHHHDASSGQVMPHAHIIDGQDTGAPMHAVGTYADLAAGVGTGIETAP